MLSANGGCDVLSGELGQLGSNLGTGDRGDDNLLDGILLGQNGVVENLGGSDLQSHVGANLGTTPNGDTGSGSTLGSTIINDNVIDVLSSGATLGQSTSNSGQLGHILTSHGTQLGNDVLHPLSRYIQ